MKGESFPEYNVKYLKLEYELFYFNESIKILWIFKFNGFCWDFANKKLSGYLW